MLHYRASALKCGGKVRDVRMETANVFASSQVHILI